MHWIQNLKSKIIVCGLYLFLGNVSHAQVDIEINYNPGIAGVLPTVNVNPTLLNAGILFIIHPTEEESGFFGGLQILNRGSGARVPVFQNGTFIRYERSSENYYHAHIPLGFRFKQQSFYVDAGIAIDQFLFYRQRRANTTTSTQQPTPELRKNTLFGFHLEGGLMKDLSEDIKAKLGIQISNTFSSNIPQNYLNLGLSAGLVFKFGSVQTEDFEDDEYLDY